MHKVERPKFEIGLQFVPERTRVYATRLWDLATARPGNTNPQGIADPPVSSATAALATESAVIDFPSLSTSAPSRSYTPKRRPTHAAITNTWSSGDLNLLARTNLATQQTAENGTLLQRHAMISDAVAVDAALEEMDYSVWTELLAEI